MKNVIISLLALAAISGTALASNNSVSQRDRNDYFGKHSTKMVGSATGSNAFAVVKGSKKGMTAFERMNLNAAESRGDKAHESRGRPEA